MSFEQFEQIVASFSGYGTRDLMRVARLFTQDPDRWTLTANGRVWRAEGQRWMAYDQSSGQPLLERGYIINLADADLRIFIIEQLIEFDITASSWHMECH